MGDTTSNEGKAIVTQGTPHTAKNQGTIDMCVSSPPAQPVIKPFKNEIDSSRLAAGKTTQTKIANQSIMNQNTYIGPPSRGDEVPWITGQTSGQPFNNWAKADAWSSDVKTEGGFVVRSDDATQQNANNSGGTMDGGALDGDQTTVPQAAILKCTMEKLEGESVAKEAALDLKNEGNGIESAAQVRVLYKKSKSAQKEDYIEILSGDTVEFVSTRLEATNISGDPAVDPKCGLEPRHTIWRIKRTGGGQEVKTDEKDGKKYTLDSSITNVSKSYVVNYNHDGKGIGEKMITVQQGGGNHTALPQGWDPSEQAVDAGATSYGTAQKHQGGTKAVEVDVGAVWTFLKFRGNPCKVQVDAIACAGPKTAWVRIFPHPPIKLSLQVGTETQHTRSVGQSARNDFIDWVYANFGKLRSLCNKIAQIVGLVGHVDFRFVMFVGFKFELECGYKYVTKELTTKAGDWRSEKNFVGLAWSLTVSSDPLIKFSITIGIPVVALAAAFFTGPGAAVVIRGLRWIEDRVGRFSLDFTAALAVGISFNATRDQHEKWSGSGKLDIKPTLQIALQLSVPKAGIWASAGSTLNGKITFTNGEPPPTHFLRVDRKGELIFNVWAEAKVKGRVLWIGPKYEWSGRKEFVIFRYSCGLGHSDHIPVGQRATS